MEKSLENKDRLVSIINSPGNNPTGYSLSDEEWDEVIKTCQDFAKKGKKITLIVDVAYIEYAGSGKQKEFFEKFTDLDPNFFVIVAYSMSKSHTAYGLRSGAAIGISSKKEIIEEFENSLAHSARCNWSNGVHAPQLILKELEDDKEGYKKELEDLRLMLEKRAEIFVREALAKNLEMIPYFGGFFTFIPTDKAFEIAENLEKENIFTIPQAKGIRVAICATNEKDIIKLVDRLSFYMANI